MKILLFANGDEPNEGWDWARAYVSPTSILIAADGGSRHIKSLGLYPDIIVGDLDSFDDALDGGKQFGNSSLVTFQEDKDESDLELALIHAASLDPEAILVFGAAGGRLDQTISNALLLALPKLRGLSVQIMQPHQSAWRFNRRTVIKGQKGDLVSLLPLWGDAVVQSTSGLKWSLSNERLAPGPARGISNELISPKAVVTLSSGSLLCVHTERSWKR
ncbi:MAG: thiamine diphosphokinase [Candidatus Promineifilaceae bacterium]